MLGAGVICDTLEKRLGIGDGGITEDGFVELHYVRCLGCCGLAPVLTIGKDVYGNVKINEVENILNKYMEKQK